MSTLQAPRWDDVAIGTRLPELVLPPLTRTTLAIYCGASGDHNPVHVDSDFARAAGLGDVIAHGMLVMAWSGRALTGWVPQAAIRSFDTRFQAVTRIGDAITVRGEVTDKFDDDGRRCARIELTACDQRGETKTRASAVVELA